MKNEKKEMSKKTETTAKKAGAKKKKDDISLSIIKDFQNVLVKHGFGDNGAVKFSIGSETAAAAVESDLNCPPGFHLEKKQIIENGKPVAVQICVKD